MARLWAGRSASRGVAHLLSDQLPSLVRHEAVLGENIVELVDCCYRAAARIRCRSSPIALRAHFWELEFCCFHTVLPELLADLREIRAADNANGDMLHGGE